MQTSIDTLRQLQIQLADEIVRLVDVRAPRGMEVLVDETAFALAGLPRDEAWHRLHQAIVSAWPLYERANPGASETALALDLSRFCWATMRRRLQLEQDLGSRRPS